MNSRDKIIKVGYLVALAGLILALGIPWLVIVQWPKGAAVSPDALAYPLMLLIATITTSIITRIVWEKQSDGTYIMDRVTRWAFIGTLLISMCCTLLVIALVVKSRMAQ